MSLSLFVHSIPPLVIVSVLSAFLLLCLGWISTIRASFRSARGKGLRLLAIFPISTPIALLILAFRDFKAALSPIVIFLAAILSLPFGGYIASTSSKAQLAGYEAQLKDKGVSIRVDALKPVPGPPEDNVWNHPILQPLADAGAATPAGEAARERLNQPGDDTGLAALKSLKPLASSVINYESDTDVTAPLQRMTAEGGAFRRFHSAALTALMESQGRIDESSIPTTWLECAQLILDHYRPREETLTQLEEAVRRPNDHYPYEWDKGFAMLLPHLAHLKELTQTTVTKAQAAAAAGSIDETFRMIDLGLRLTETGDSDLLISRLVQFAQAIIVLDAIHVAQQLHIGTEEEWASIQNRLAEWDFPALIADSLNAERAFGTASMLSVTEGKPHELVRSINQLGAAVQGPSQEKNIFGSGLRFLFDHLVGGSAESVIFYNWHQAIEAYEEFIANVNKAYNATRNQPWNQCPVPPLPKPVASYGIFAKMLLPALDSAFNKAVTVQHKVELAKLAIALERFYVAHLSYPESLPDLAPIYLTSAPRDPMTGDEWSYQRLENGQGFVLYSKGTNGRDDGGHYDRKSAREPDGLDDAGWAICPQRPALPKFVLGNESSPGASPEMQQRYGLEVETEPGQ